MSETPTLEAPHPWLGHERERLADLLDSGRVKLGVHIRKVNSPGSPVYRAMENILPAAALLTSSFAATAPNVMTTEV